LDKKKKRTSEGGADDDDEHDEVLGGGLDNGDMDGVDLDDDRALSKRRRGRNTNGWLFSLDKSQS